MKRLMLISIILLLALIPLTSCDNFPISGYATVALGNNASYTNTSKGFWDAETSITFFLYKGIVDNSYIIETLGRNSTEIHIPITQQAFTIYIAPHWFLFSELKVSYDGQLSFKWEQL